MTVRDDLRAAVERLREAVEPVARALHADPETADDEVRAVERLVGVLGTHGFDIDLSAGDPTAFVARTGTGGTRVAVCLEYDGLPEIGHGCGHNLIAGAGLLTALALAEQAEGLDLTVLAVGCPAEERGGGKIPLIEEGVFADVDLAIMVHPVPDGIRLDPRGTSSQAIGQFLATYTGRSAHAAAAPHLGRNTTDAVVVAEVALALLRQQVPADHRLSANVVRSGSVPNVIPDHATIEFECRAWTTEEYDALRGRVTRCLEAGALATECELTVEPVGRPYEPLRQDETLGALWCDALSELGLDPAAGVPLAGGSTDMGNVSQVVPALHPWVRLPGVSASL
ncbi:MAG TPA: amidohydrolase, partial [Propionibacteriaceae bacterium]|nr:amidohydrolase [Propionibacteriaceae bacterium]